MKQKITRFRYRKLRQLELKHFALSLLIAILTLAAMPRASLAQRGRTSKGKVERTQSRAKKSKATKSGARSSRSSGRKSGARKSTPKKSGGKLRSASRSGSNARSSGKSKASGKSRGVSRNNRSNTVSVRSQDRNARDRSSRASGSRRSPGKSRATQNRVRNGGSTSGRDVGQAGSKSRPSRNSRARSSSGRKSGVRGATRASNNQRIVIQGRRSRLNLPHVAAKYRHHGSRHIRFRPLIRFRLGHSHYGHSYRHINVHIAWPWQLRFHRHWSPRYTYRQVVFVEAKWGRRNRSTRVEMETTYRHKVRFANDEYAVLDIEIEEIALYDGDSFLGSVDRIPGNLANIEATVFRNGDIAFDRDVFIVGDRSSGFEIISTEYDDGYALAGHKSGRGYQVGRLDLCSGRVRSVQRSRLFNPENFRGYAPISLLPEQEGWLWDYGLEALSAESDDYGDYYGYSSANGVGYRSSAVTSAESEYEYSTAFGADFSVNRKSEIRRIE